MADKKECGNLNNIKVAIDGPAGAGKSSVSRCVAKKLGLVYVDTGAMYRACAVYALENGIDINEEDITPHLDEINIDIDYNENGQRVFLNGTDVSERIRELMKEENLTQVELANKIGLKQNTISAWLLNKKEPSIRSLWLVADYFNVDIDYLVGRKDI